MNIVLGWIKSPDMTWLNWLDHLDKTLFVLIQHDTDGSVLDKIMPILREPLTWVPLYAFMLFFVFRQGKAKAWPFIILTLLTVAVTDTVAAQLLKPLFARLRPCHDPDLQGMIRGLVDCGGLYSMPSNHAANHFGLAAFWYFSIREMNGRKWIGFGSGRQRSAMRRSMWANIIPSTFSLAQPSAS